MFTHVKENVSEVSAKQAGVGLAIYLGPAPYPVKSSVLRWHPVLSRFYPRVKQSNKKYEETEGCEQSSHAIFPFPPERGTTKGEEEEEAT